MSHKDQVITLPPNAIKLGENTHCPYSMFQVDEHFLGIQAHPEFEGQYAEQLMLSRSKIIDKKILNSALSTVNLKLHRKEIANWIVNFIKK